MTIYLISGHGHGDPGATATINNVVYKESDETIKFVRLLYDSLKSVGYDVEAYPYENDAYQDYKKGLLKLPQSDLLIEVHFNAVKFDLGDNKTKGCEAFTTKYAKEQTNRIAQEIVSNISGVCGLTNRGVKQYNYSVINYSEQHNIPAILLEVCFIDDTDDMKIYTVNRLNAVNAVFEVIKKNFPINFTKRTVTMHETTPKYKTFNKNTTTEILINWKHQGVGKNDFYI